MRNNQRADKYAYRVDDEIYGYNECRVIYKQHRDSETEGDFNKVMSLSEAKEIARDLSLDIIEINRNGTPPIVRIYDYGKFLWEKKQDEKKKKSNTVATKEIQLTVNISMHDIEIKAKKAAEFLSKGDRVKVVLTMRGRELGRRDVSKRSFYEFLNILDGNFSYESQPRDEGNKTIVVLRPKK